MTQSPYDTGLPPQPAPTGKGLATAALVCGILTLLTSCLIPLALLFGIAAIICAIIALSSKRPGRGLAITGLSLGGAGILLSIPLFIIGGVMLPALGQARTERHKVMSATQLRIVGQALQVYANANKDWYPESDADWADRLIAAGAISEEVLHAPGDSSGARSYFYIPGYKMEFDSRRVLAYERPGLWRRGGGNIVFDDGHVEFVESPQYEQLIDNLRTADGKPYAPHKRGTP